MNKELQKVLQSKTEKEFFKNIADVVDDLLKLDGIAEMFDNYAVLVSLKTLDKTVLDKKLGEDWFNIYVLPILTSLSEENEN